MSFGAFQQDQAQVIAEINTTPLIDVLLVLLVVFLVTLPLAATTVPIKLPETQADSAPMKRGAMVVTIDAEGRAFWGETPVSLTEIERRFAEAGPTDRELRLRVDAATPFESVAQVLAAANRHRITQIGFVTRASKAQ